MRWYDNGQKILALATIAMGMSLGDIAIATPKAQSLEAEVHACPIEGFTNCVTTSRRPSAQPSAPTKQVTDTTPPVLPVPIEPFQWEPVWIEPIEAIPLEPISIDPLEAPPLGSLFPDSGTLNFPSDPIDDPPIYHIVLVDLIDTATEAEIEALIADGEASIASIPGVLAVDIGLKLRDDRDVHIRDYDLGVYVKLDSTALDAYGAHPNHQAFVERQRHLWSSIRVIDFSGSAPSTSWNDYQY